MFLFGVRSFLIIFAAAAAVGPLAASDGFRPLARVPAAAAAVTKIEKVGAQKFEVSKS